ncbi:tyrosine-type recombinase/integrase [Pseudoroseomonas wenyumeiae]
MAYYRSAEFKRMDERSQRVRRLILDRFRQGHGTKPAARLEARHLVAIRDDRSDTPEAANSLLKALRAVYRHGLALSLVYDNPAAKVTYLPGSAEGFHAWTLEEVQRFEAHHPIGTKARLAMALLLYTGQRRSDVVKLGRQHVRNGWLAFTQHKNRNRHPVRLELPIVPELQLILEASPVGELAFLVSERGTPFTAETFGNRFRKWCRRRACRSAHRMG